METLFVVERWDRVRGVLGKQGWVTVEELAMMLVAR
jgi:hypothetical protein